MKVCQPVAPINTFSYLGAILLLKVNRRRAREVEDQVRQIFLRGSESRCQCLGFVFFWGIKTKGVLENWKSVV